MRLVHKKPANKKLNVQPTAKQVEEENNAPEETPEYLNALLGRFTTLNTAAVSRKARMEDLMKRKSTKKWSPEKTAKMVRRLMTSAQDIEQSTFALDEIGKRLAAKQ